MLRICAVTAGLLLTPSYVSAMNNSNTSVVQVMLFVGFWVGVFYAGYRALKAIWKRRKGITAWTVAQKEAIRDEYSWQSVSDGPRRKVATRPLSRGSGGYPSLCTKGHTQTQSDNSTPSQQTASRSPPILPFRRLSWLFSFFCGCS